MPVQNSQTYPDRQYADIDESGNCFNCKYLVKGTCTHNKKVVYQEITTICNNCGRKPGEEKRGCGECIGRGAYCYPHAYDQCDCGGFSKK